MTALLACRKNQSRLLQACGLLVIAAACILQHPALAADATSASATSAPITVHVDQARILKLPERTTTLVIGNPMIADATVQPGGVMVLTAKSYGVTNVLALDQTGSTLMEHTVRVLGPTDKVVVLYRGVERESYTCAPNCERRITLGDSQNYFTQTMGQTTSRNAQAQASAQK